MARALVLMLCGSFAVSAATLQQLSMDEIARSATSIVRARIGSSSASLTGPTIYTHYKLQVSEIWKGAPPPEVMLPGGVAAGFRQSFPGVPQLNPGAEYVLFLWTSRAGITHIVGLTQGLFSVSAQPDGSIEADRPKIGETMLDAKGQPVVDQPVRMKVADMKARVSQALVSGAQK